jgi:hypothetical protein
MHKSKNGVSLERATNLCFMNRYVLEILSNFGIDTFENTEIIQKVFISFDYLQ